VQSNPSARAGVRRQDGGVLPYGESNPRIGRDARNRSAALHAVPRLATKRYGPQVRANLNLLRENERLVRPFARDRTVRVAMTIPAAGGWGSLPAAQRCVRRSDVSVPAASGLPPDCEIRDQALRIQQRPAGMRPAVTGCAKLVGYASA
jgi:hypothetical protein